MSLIPTKHRLTSCTDQELVREARRSKNKSPRISTIIEWYDHSGYITGKHRLYLQTFLFLQEHRKDEGQA